MTSNPSPLDNIQIPGNRTGVLLIHGFSGSLEELRGLSTDLAEEGWTVHGIWLAGHGTSVEDLATKNYNDWVLSVRRGLIALQQETDRIVIVGESFGGNLALHAALIGQPIAGVVCLGTPVTLRRDLLTRAALPFLKRYRPYHRKGWVTLTPEQLAAEHRYARLPMRGLGEVISFIDRHTKRELEGVQVPLLIIQAKKDFEVDPASAYFLAEHVGSQRAEIIWVDERVHHVLTSPLRPELVDRIKRFIHQNTGS